MSFKQSWKNALLKLSGIKDAPLAKELNKLQQDGKYIQREDGQKETPLRALAPKYLPPSGGDSAKKDLAAWKEYATTFKTLKDKGEPKIEVTKKKTDFGSPLTYDKGARVEKLTTKDEELNVNKPTYTTGSNSNWKKMANVYVRCPNCGHEGDEDSFDIAHEGFMDENLRNTRGQAQPYGENLEGHVCPMCGYHFTPEEGDPMDSMQNGGPTLQGNHFSAINEKEPVHKYHRPWKTPDSLAIHNFIKDMWQRGISSNKQMAGEVHTKFYIPLNDAMSYVLEFQDDIDRGNDSNNGESTYDDHPLFSSKSEPIFRVGAKFSSKVSGVVAEMQNLTAFSFFKEGMKDGKFVYIDPTNKEASVPESDNAVVVAYIRPETNDGKTYLTKFEHFMKSFQSLQKSGVYLGPLSDKDVYAEGILHKIDSIITSPANPDEKILQIKLLVMKDVNPRDSERITMHPNASKTAVIELDASQDLPQLVTQAISDEREAISLWNQIIMRVSQQGGLHKVALLEKLDEFRADEHKHLSFLQVFNTQVNPQIDPRMYKTFMPEGSWKSNLISLADEGKIDSSYQDEMIEVAENLTHDTRDKEYGKKKEAGVEFTSKPDGTINISVEEPLPTAPISGSTNQLPPIPDANTQQPTPTPVTEKPKKSASDQKTQRCAECDKLKPSDNEGYIAGWVCADCRKKEKKASFQVNDPIEIPNIGQGVVTAINGNIVTASCNGNQYEANLNDLE